jgi:hypothetical protein
MKPAKLIRRFIRKSVKASGEPNEAELNALLNGMSLEQLQDFWFHFSSDFAFSATNTVPHWKTKEQQSVLRDEILRLAFWPKEKDASGKNIIGREEFQAHISQHLIEHIQKERRQAKDWKRRPFDQKVPAYLGMAVVVLSPPFTVCVIMAENRDRWGIGQIGVLLFAFTFGAYLVSGFIATCIAKVRWRHARRLTAKQDK